MPRLSSPLTARVLATARVRTQRRIRSRVALTLLAAALAGASVSCRSSTGQVAWRPDAGVENGIYPPAPQSPRVVALGNLQSGPGPTPTQVKLSVFLFGTEPEPALAFVRPTDVAPQSNGLVVCDGGLACLLAWNAKTGVLAQLPASGPVRHPSAISPTPDGQLLITDPDAGVVQRLASDGSERTRYRMPDVEFRPADAIQVNGKIWATNVAGHCIEIFDAETGSHERTVGERGSGPLEFGMPMGMAPCPDGNVCVVDVLNGRVQVISPDGRFVRSIGAPGDVAGRFGRPRDVAVGPDGTIFVTDAAAQRVHAFDAQGRVLLAFGDQRDPVGGLSMPHGVCVVRNAPTGKALPDGFKADYYVCVAEQLLRPGIRVYAWGRRPGEADRPSSGATASTAGPSTVPNPHWSPTRCDQCHQTEAGRPMKIAAERTDAMCLNCHDGRKAHAEPHPIGRTATTASVSTPADWPTNDGLIGCLTCHDIQRHCSGSAVRPAVNPAMLRHYDIEKPLNLCLKCHSAAETWRISPHRQVNERGGVKSETCTFCHVAQPAVASDGQRRGAPQLHTSGSPLCLTCHTRHWDVSPRGHVDRPVPAAILETMRTRKIPATGTQATASGSGATVAAVFPLAGGNVTCYTCHNPHEPGIFPAGSPMAAFGSKPTDRGLSLRVSSTVLCLTCHEK